METTSIQRLLQLHPAIQYKAVQGYLDAVKATPAGVHPYIVESVRSFDRSNELYKLGRTVVNPDGRSASKPMGDIVTNSQAGQSYHNYGLAFDFCLQINGQNSWAVDKNWMTVVNCFKKYGFTWGGGFTSIPDSPHLQMTFNKSWSDLLTLYQAGKFIPTTQFVLI